jgi:hypothetical protein
MTNIELITSKNVKDNIFKILISKENEKLSQFDIFTRLSEIYNIDNAKINTRSSNKKIKYLFMRNLKYIQQSKDIFTFVDNGILYFKYHSYNNTQIEIPIITNCKDNKFDESDKYDESDESDESSESDESDESDDENESYYDDESNDDDEYLTSDDEYLTSDNNIKNSINNKKSNIIIPNNDIFEELINDIDNNKQFLEQFRDCNNNTVSHHLVSDLKYINLIQQMVKYNIFHFDEINDKHKTPIECASPLIYNKLNKLYISKIATDVAKTVVKNNCITMSHVQSEIEKKLKFNINLLLFLFFILVICEIFLIILIFNKTNIQNIFDYFNLQYK